MKQFAFAAAVIVLVVFVSHRGRAGAGAGAAAAGATVSQPAPLRPRRAQSPQAVVVYVAGAVLKPGLYRLTAGSRADDAVRAAGGFAPSADRAGVNLAERVEDGDEVRVPSIGEAAPRRRSPTAGRRRRSKHRKALAAPVDLNAATAAQLQNLPGVGSTLAQRIVTFRAINGPFASVDELLDVAGMTQRRFDTLAPMLAVNGVH